MEKFILNLLESASKVNYDALMQIVVIGLGIFWLSVVVSVFMDAKDRSRNIIFPILAALLVLFLPILGLIIYNIIKPKHSADELYFADLERRYLKYETAELGDCFNCGFQLQPGFIACPNCSYTLKTKCEECGVYGDKDWKFCPFCANRKAPVENKDVKPYLGNLNRNNNAPQQQQNNRAPQPRESIPPVKQVEQPVPKPNEGDDRPKVQLNNLQRGPQMPQSGSGSPIEQPRQNTDRLVEQIRTGNTTAENVISSPVASTNQNGRGLITNIGDSVIGSVSTVQKGVVGTVGSVTTGFKSIFATKPKTNGSSDSDNMASGSSNENSAEFKKFKKKKKKKHRRK